MARTSQREDCGTIYDFFPPLGSLRICLLFVASDIYIYYIFSYIYIKLCIFTNNHIIYIYIYNRLFLSWQSEIETGT